MLKVNPLILENNTITTGDSYASSKWMTAGMCVAASVVLHILVVALICIRLITASDDARSAESKDTQVEEMVIAIKLPELKPLIPEEPVLPSENAPLTPQELKSLIAKTPDAEKPDVQPKPENRPNNVQQFARTTDDQLSGKSEDAVIQGERDTIEASNTDAVTGAPDRISVKGEAPKSGEQETVDTTFQDGVLEHMNRGAEESKPQLASPSEKIADPNDPEKLAELDQESDEDIDQEEKKSSVEATNELGDALEKGKLATTNKEHKKFLDTEKKALINEELPTAKNIAANENKGIEELKKTIANNELDPDAIKQKTQDEKKKSEKSQAEAQAETLPKTAENKRASESNEKGFRSQAKAKVMEGSISRRSKIASKNVKSTPVGKYMAQISKIVEKEWQRRMMMHADLVQPGTLRIGFMVNEKGKIINYRIISQSFGSENQNSLTFQALGSAKIPVMPQAVKESQGGDPLEFIYSFNFQ